VKALLRKLTAGYAAVTDMPFCMYVPELMEIYPNAKVVLVERDPEKWWPSMKQVLDHAENPIAPLITYLTPDIRWVPAAAKEMSKLVNRQLDAAGLDRGPGE
jgi:hypothetical protein